MAQATREEACWRLEAGYAVRTNCVDALPSPTAGNTAGLGGLTNQATSVYPGCCVYVRGVVSFLDLDLDLASRTAGDTPNL
jgi:hypothetical protein